MPERFPTLPLHCMVISFVHISLPGSSSKIYGLVLSSGCAQDWSLGTWAWPCRMGVQKGSCSSREGETGGRLFRARFQRLPLSNSSPKARPALVANETLHGEMLSLGVCGVSHPRTQCLDPARSPLRSLPVLVTIPAQRSPFIPMSDDFPPTKVFQEHLPAWPTAAF